MAARLRIAFLCGACAAAAGAAPSRDEVLACVDKSTASRLVALAGKTDRAKQRETARRFYERALALDPDSPAARAKLGYRHAKGGWERSADALREVRQRRDARPAEAFALRGEVVKLEAWRSREIVRICGKYGDPATARPVLLALLERTPRLPEVHRALGHAEIGGIFVRPELEALARAGTGPWQAAVAAKAATRATSDVLAVPGLKGRHPLVEIGGRRVTAVHKAPWPQRFAEATEVPYRLLRVLLGSDAALWTRTPTVFMNAAEYTAMIHRLYRGESARKRRLRFGNYLHRNFMAIRVLSVADAHDFYAHLVAYRTIEDRCSPPLRSDPEKTDKETYAWAKEGFGYLVSIESFGTALSRFVSTKESTDKIRYTLPPPAQKTRGACHEWVRAQMEDGLGLALREICGRSLNNLDYLASLQAYTFVRFLFLYDPAGARALPEALAAQADGTPIERSDRALRAAFGKGIEDLAPLWRIYTLEIL